MPPPPPRIEKPKYKQKQHKKYFKQQRATHTFTARIEELVVESIYEAINSVYIERNNVCVSL